MFQYLLFAYLSYTPQKHNSMDKITCNTYAVKEPFYKDTAYNKRIALRWTITLRNRGIPLIELPLSDALNNSQRHKAGLLFHSELISYSPLVSILMTTAHPVLNGATNYVCKNLFR